MNAFKQRERVVIIDPAGTFYVSPLLKFDDANELHAQQSTLATVAFPTYQPEACPLCAAGKPIVKPGSRA